MPEEAILYNDVHDIEPLDTWHRGRVVVAPWYDMESALAVYGARRRPRTARVVRDAWRIGQLGQLGQLRHPLACWLRETLTRLTPDRVALRQVSAIVNATI